MTMHPFYHPTSIVVVDDDPLFLGSFDFYFGDSFVCHSFTDPRCALDYVEQCRTRNPNLERYVSRANHEEDINLDDRGSRTIRFRASNLSQLIQDEQRFAQVSVAIVDYDMPGMTGIEVCRRLKAWPVRTILLTGKASMEAAVAAFNEQLIDCFLMKQDTRLTERIKFEIARLQRAYFAEATRALGVVCALDDVKFLEDQAFATLFKSMCESEDVAEYYLSVDPVGILLIRQDGSTVFMPVHDEDRLRAHLEIAAANGAPRELLVRMEEGEFIPIFPTESGFFEPELRDTWRKHVWPAHVVHGARPWRYAMLEGRELGPHAFPQLTTFADFKNRLQA